MESFTFAQALPGVLLLMQSKEYLHRAVEIFDSSSGQLRRRLSLDLTVPGAEYGLSEELEGLPVLLPLLPVTKGRLIDDLSVTVGDDAVSILTTRANNEFVQGAIIEVGMSCLPAHTPEALRLVAHRVLSDLARQVAGEPEDAVAAYNSFFGKQGSGPRLMRADSALSELCAQATTDFFLIALIPRLPGERVIVKVDLDTSVVARDPVRTRGFSLRVLKEAVYRWCVQMRIQPPSAFTLQVSLPRIASSYHAKMDAPPGFFVDDQVVLKPGSEENEIVPERLLDRVDTKSRLGSTSAHVFLQVSDRTDADGGSQLALGIRFRPDPVGPLLVAAMIGLLGFFAFAFASLNAGVLLEATAPVAVLLGAPGALLALVVGRLGYSGGGRWFAAPLRARLLVAATTATSLVLVALFETGRLLNAEPVLALDQLGFLTWPRVLGVLSGLCALSVLLLSAATGGMLRECYLRYRSLTSARDNPSRGHSEDEG